MAHPFNATIGYTPALIFAVVGLNLLVVFLFTFLWALLSTFGHARLAACVASNISGRRK